MSNINLINELFERLYVIYPAWKHSLVDAQQIKTTKQVWSQALIAAGIVDSADIKRGLAKAALKGGAFMISPGDFIEYCKKGLEDFGLPDLDTAHRMILHATRYHNDSNWSGVPDGVRWAYILLKDRSQWRGMPLEKQRRELEYSYKTVLLKLRGGELPPVFDIVPKEKRIEPIKSTKQQAEAHIASLKAMLQE